MTKTDSCTSNLKSGILILASQFITGMNLPCSLINSLARSPYWFVFLQQQGLLSRICHLQEVHVATCHEKGNADTANCKHQAHSDVAGQLLGAPAAGMVHSRILHGVGKIYM